MTETPTTGPYAFRNQPENLDPPSEIDAAASYSLQTFLQERGSFETPEDNEKRIDVLVKLNELVTQFVREVYRAHNNDLSNIDSVHGKLVTYGSFRLGISSPGSDIDALCIAPRYVTRTDFFQTFYKILLNHTLVTNLVKIDTATVPLLTMRFQGIDVDLAFAQLATNEIDPAMDDSYLENDNILNDIDARTITSLNGVRVSNMIQKLVPNVENFGILLRFIRIWSKERGIYGNVYGYLGGVNCALLCAFICQRYPKALPSMLVLMFFQDLSTWSWPEPIYINTPNTGTQVSWDNSVGTTGRRDLMPIITPAYPAMNSLKSATRSSRQKMMKEFHRGYKLTKRVLLKGLLWDAVVAPSNFFMQYRKYVQVNVWAGTKEDYNKWVGTIESRIRKLTCMLECVRFMTGVYIWPDHFDHPDEEGHENAGSFFIAIEYDIPKEESVDRRIDISEACQKFIDYMYQYNGRTDQMGIFMKLRDRPMLPDFVFPNGRPAPKHKTKMSSGV